MTRSESPVDDLLAPVDYTLADTQIGSALGVTTLPHVRELAIAGPQKVTGVSDTVSRRRVFTVPADLTGRRSAVRGEDSARRWRTRPIGAR